MYSRSMKVRADDRYANNVPPVYGGSRFYRAPPDDGIAVQYEARRMEEPPTEGAEITAEEVFAQSPCDPPLCEVSEEGEAEAADGISEESVSAEACLSSFERKERHGTFLQSFIEGDKEEILLIAVLLLLCGEENRAGDMIAILLLLIILR